MAKWFRLVPGKQMKGYPRLRIGAVDDGQMLVLQNVPQNTEVWRRCIDILGFAPIEGSRFLVRALSDEDRGLVKASWIRQVFPMAEIAQMDPSEYVYIFRTAANGDGEESAEAREIRLGLKTSTYLGINADGLRVYQGPFHRFLITKTDQKQEEPNWSAGGEVDAVAAAKFLRATSAEGLALCADGFVEQMMLEASAVSSAQFESFVNTLYPDPGTGVPRREAKIREVYAAVEAAALRRIRKDSDTANGAYALTRSIYERMPPCPFTGRGAASMPLVVSVLAQRLLGDTDGANILVPNAFDGASFAFAEPTAKVTAWAGNVDLRAHASWADEDGPEVVWREDIFRPSAVPAGSQDALFMNMDPSETQFGQRADHVQTMQALRALRPDGVAVLVLAATQTPADAEFLRDLSSTTRVELAFDLGEHLVRNTGGGALRIICVRNAPPVEGAQALTLARVAKFHGWDPAKDAIDEALLRMDVKERKGRRREENARAENPIQRPYAAFSRLGASTMMAPANLQVPMQNALARIEEAHGLTIDDYVVRETGYPKDILAQRFDPEQIDAIALLLERMRENSGLIIADQTGAGKGRVLAAAAAIAERRGKKVIFFTERPNLYSDLFRDLINIGEHGRFIPFITNADAEIVDHAGVVLHKHDPVALSRALNDHASLGEIGCNMVMTNYSQIAAKDSKKADWIASQVDRDTVLILDEAHVAAGMDSNTAAAIERLTMAAGAVVYSSATWAKSHKNIALYGRAFPHGTNMASIAETLRSGGTPMLEMVSGMLAETGALRCVEHDMSKADFEFVVDEASAPRNREYADAVAAIMGEMAFMSGEVDRLARRMERENMSVLREAREAREVALREVVTLSLDQGGGDAPRRTSTKVSILRPSFGAGSMLYQTMKRMIAAMDAVHGVERAVAALERGEKPVLVFSDTAESFVRDSIKEQIAEGRALADVRVRMPGVADVLKGLLRRMTEVREYVAAPEDLEWDAGSSAGAGDDRGDAADLDAAAAEARAAAQAEGGAAGRVGGAPAASEPTADAGADGRVEAEDEDEEEDGEGAGRRRRAAPRTASLVLRTQKLKHTYVDIRDRIDDAAKCDAISKGIERISRAIDGLPDLPISVIDVARNALEARNIRCAEITGRKYRLVPAEDGLFAPVPATAGRRAVNATVRAFNSGEIDVALINVAARSGLSLHASPSFADRRPRRMIVVQSPEDPTAYTQILGRTNRKDQVGRAGYDLLNCGIPAEIRRGMMQNEKLRKLSASVRSSTHHSAVDEGIVDLDNPAGDRVVQDYFRDNPLMASRLMFDEERLNPKRSEGCADYFLSRACMLTSTEFEKLYGDIVAMYESQVAEAEENGESLVFRSGEMDVRARRDAARHFMGYSGDSRLLPMLSPFDAPVTMRDIAWTEIVTPMDWDDALGEILKGRYALLADRKAVALLHAHVPDVESDPIGPRPEALPPKPQASLVDSNLTRDVVLGPRGRGMPSMDLTPLALRTADQLRVLARTAVLLEGKYASVEEAISKIMAEQPGEGESGLSSPIKRFMAREHFARVDLMAFIPGAEIQTNIGATPEDGFKSWLILNVRPPEAGQENQFARWKFDLLDTSGRRTTRSLAALVSQNVHSAYDIFSEDPTRIGSRYNTWRNLIRNAFSGPRNVRATVLDGNLLQASQFIDALEARPKPGRLVMYTEDAGNGRTVKHRAIILHNRYTANALNAPARAWEHGPMSQVIGKAMEFLRQATRETIMFPVGPKSAWKLAMGRGIDEQRDMYLLVKAGELILSAPKGEKSAIARNLRSGLEAYCKREGADAGSISIRAVARKPYIGIRPKAEGMTDADFVHLAVHALIEGPGLDIYSTRAEWKTMIETLSNAHIEAQAQENLSRLRNREAEQAARPAGGAQDDIAPAGLAGQGEGGVDEAEEAARPAGLRQAA